MNDENKNLILKQQISRSEEDYLTTRNNLKTLIDKSMFYVETLCNIGEDMDKPSSYKEVFECIKIAGELNEKLNKLNQNYEKKEHIKKNIEKADREDPRKGTGKINLTVDDLLNIIESSQDRGLEKNIVDITPEKRQIPTKPKTLINRDKL